MRNSLASLPVLNIHLAVMAITTAAGRAFEHHTDIVVFTAVAVSGTFLPLSCMWPWAVVRQPWSVALPY